MTIAQRFAARLGLTEGQAYTAVTGLAVAVALLGLGLPSLRDVASPLPVAAGRTSPLALPGSPAVAETISAAEVPVAEPATDFASAPTTSGDAPSFPGAAPESTFDSDMSGDEPVVMAGPPEPLRVVLARYASASGPLVPGGSPGQYLPVTLRVGAPDKQSYLRLAGQATTLTLPLSTQPAHQLGEVGAVRACRITTASWTFDDGASLSTAPQVDPVDCALGRPGERGWTFELANVDTRNGVALVPSGSSTDSFQATFMAAAP